MMTVSNTSPSTPIRRGAWAKASGRLSKKKRTAPTASTPVVTHAQFS